MYKFTTHIDNSSLEVRTPKEAFKQLNSFCKNLALPLMSKKQFDFMMKRGSRIKVQKLPVYVLMERTTAEGRNGTEHP